MKKATNIILIIVLVLIVGAIYYLERPETMEMETGEVVKLGPIFDEQAKPEVGFLAPDFLLMDYEGQPHKLSDYRGKYVLLNFWAAWCPFCIEEMPLFQSFYDEFSAKGGSTSGGKDAGLEIVAVNRGESRAVAQKYSNQLGLTYPLLLNQDDTVYGAYQGRAMPMTFLIDQEGVILDIKFGPYTEEGLRADLKEFFGLGLTREEELETMARRLEEKIEAAINVKIGKSTRKITVTNGVKHSVPLEDILSGGPPRDGIPSIDNPKFISIEEADKYLDDEGLGIAVSLNGIDRFYPNQITVWHEIVNDVIGDQPVLVTYCPLCGTGIVFESTVKGRPTEFGTSGKLWNSNLVMYDRQTQSFWSQALGESIRGELTGTKLKLLPYDNLLYKDWKKIHPKGEVLSRDTGSIRDYDRDPYGDYYSTESIFFPVDYTDERYHSKEPTFGIELNGKTKVYPQSELEKGPAEFTDTFAGVNLKISFDKNIKTIDIRRLDNNEEVIPFYGFWFSWISVHPETEVWVAE